MNPRRARLLLLGLALSAGLAAQTPADSGRLEHLKREALEAVDAESTLVQRIVDQLFSYGELGFQETETSRYLVNLLRTQGFTIEDAVAGVPTAWIARWGRGRPVIAIGSDLDGIPQASQMPGVACRMPLVAGAPGHGEGHNSGQALNIAIMERFRPAMRPFYYDPTHYRSYLEQLGVRYPVLPDPTGSCGPDPRDRHRPAP